MRRRRPLARGLLFLAGVLTITPLAADSIEILELSPPPPVTLDGIAVGAPITATAGNSVTVVVRYRADGGSARIEAYPRARVAGVEIRLVAPTGPVPACGPIIGPSEGRCATAFALVCTDRAPATFSIEEVGATLGVPVDVVLATDFVAPARYTFRCPGPPRSGDTSCTVIGAAGAPGATPLPFGSELPICRCLRDAGARELRCGILHPDFFALRRIPFPLPAGQPFTERWEFLALTQLDGPVKLTITGAGVADPVRHSFGAAGRPKPGKVERLVVNAMAPKEPVSLPGRVDFAYDMKDPDRELSRAFSVDRTIEVAPLEPR
jgi:hypothetical protein